MVSYHLAPTRIAIRGGEKECGEIGTLLYFLVRM